MKDKKANKLIIMVRQFMATGLILVFLACLFGSGCAGLGNRQNKSNLFSLPSYSKSTKTKSHKYNKAKNAPQTLDEILGLPRS
ncbi:MAG: hypothetical protein LBH59_08435 [Planctomycetaceae bacterium]|nr:hypothetical protein [Planctomycetaceae bacterium]